MGPSPAREGKKLPLTPAPLRGGHAKRRFGPTGRGAGMWGQGTQGASRPGGQKCDPAYPTVCIPPPPPDLDCGDIPHRNFKVLAPDPHRFDRDGDGVGCEY